MLNTWTCIEVGSEIWTIWQVNRKGNVSAPEQIIMPADNLWNPQTMAKLLASPLSGRKILFLLNISSTIIKLSDNTDSTASGEVLTEEILTLFTLPPGKQSADYVFSHNIEGERIWMTAVPAEISNSLIKMCRLKGIRPGRVKIIDTMEHRMACYLGGLYQSSLWILLPQEPGIRLIILQEGIPWGCYFFSNDPDFRIWELTRLWLCQLNPPQYAVILGRNSNYAWLKDFLENKSVELLKPDHKMSLKQTWLEDFLEDNSVDLLKPDHELGFKQAMISEWIKAL